MKVFFYSIDDENNKISFNSLAKIENDYIVFQDKINKKTNIYLKILENKIIINRKGNTIMNLELIQGKKTIGYYKNELGFEIDFIADCSNLMITKSRIDVSYAMILDNQVISSHKIWIILR